MGAAGSDLGQPRKLDPALYAHDVGVTWLTAAARRGLFGELSQVVSERRMRSEDGRGNEAGTTRANRTGFAVSAAALAGRPAAGDCTTRI